MINNNWDAHFSVYKLSISLLLVLYFTINTPKCAHARAHTHTHTLLHRIVSGVLTFLFNFLREKVPWIAVGDSPDFDD